MTARFISIEKAIDVLKNGKMLILIDDESRENEGDLVIAAEFADANAINFMATYGKGLICLPMSEALIDKWQLPMMVSNNSSPYGTAFTISIEATKGVSTGISAFDRARTIAVAIDSEAKLGDLVSPGHIFPLKAKPKGVLERHGQTEGSVDLAKLANLKPAAVICEIMNADGTMSRRDELAIFSEKHQIPMVSIKDLIEYRIKNEIIVEEVAKARLPLEKYGEFSMVVFNNQLDNAEHFALTKPTKMPEQTPLVRIHSECITGDVFGSCKCDCGQQLQKSLAAIQEEGGVLVYLRQEGRGIGLANKLKTYMLQEQGLDTVDANLKLGFPADNRDYAIAYQILKYLGIESLKLMTNNPQKIEMMEKYGLKISERIPLTIKPGTENESYLRTKQQKLGHLFAFKKEENETY